jgi:hypothetical protein
MYPEQMYRRSTRSRRFGGGLSTAGEKLTTLCSSVGESQEDISS